MPAVAVLTTVTFAGTIAVPPAGAAHAETPHKEATATLQGAGPTWELTRLSGGDRYGTAVAVSQEFAAPVGTVFVATGTDFPDALSAASAAAAAGGPLLLTMRDRLPGVVTSELERLQPQRIVIVGGEGVVSKAVAEELAAIAPTERWASANRYETSAAVVTGSFPAAEHVFLATGRDYPDALSAAGPAATRGAPVLLVDGALDRLPAATINLLTGELDVGSVSIVGGYGAVSAGIHAQLQDAGLVVDRYAGRTRFETSAAVDDAFFAPGTGGPALVATGADFPDALAGAALAGLWQAPLHLTSRTCLPAGTHGSLRDFAPTSIVALGGTDVVSDAGATEPCTAVQPTRLHPVWEIAGVELSADAARPYADRPPVNVASVTVDATGLREYVRRDTGAEADHPVALAQYGLSALAEHESTADPRWLRHAVRQAEQLISIRTVSGDAWWFAYGFPWTYDRTTLSAPWWSAMAQGQALSLFVRLAERTGDLRWETAARHSWLSFVQQSDGTAPWSSVVIDGHLYFEEYAGDAPPLQVLNGQIFAMFGLYDYWRHTGDPEVAQYFDAGAATVLDMMPSIRKVGEVSYYCVRESFCQRPLWQNQKYHVIHSWQLDTLTSLTGDARFSEWAEILRSDWASVERRMPAAPEPDPLDVFVEQ